VVHAPLPRIIPGGPRSTRPSRARRGRAAPARPCCIIVRHQSSPTFYFLRTIQYELPNLAPRRSAPRRIASGRSAPPMMAPSRTALLRDARLRSVPLRFALHRRARLRSPGVTLSSASNVAVLRSTVAGNEDRPWSRPCRGLCLWHRGRMTGVGSLRTDWFGRTKATSSREGGRYDVAGQPPAAA
jgi:hypothetical protein